MSVSRNVCWYFSQKVCKAEERPGLKYYHSNDILRSLTLGGDLISRKNIMRHIHAVSPQTTENTTVIITEDNYVNCIKGHKQTSHPCLYASYALSVSLSHTHRHMQADRQTDTCTRTHTPPCPLSLRPWTMDQLTDKCVPWKEDSRCPPCGTARYEITSQWNCVLFILKKMPLENFETLEMDLEDPSKIMIFHWVLVHKSHFPSLFLFAAFTSEDGKAKYSLWPCDIILSILVSDSCTDIAFGPCFLFQMWDCASIL